ncbi:MAG: tripartite tricarboxylate transporter substrate binding protein [Pseudomonadota bacterium]
MRILVLLSVLCGLSSAAISQSYPSRPVRFVVPYAAGGPADIVARIVGPGMTTQIGQQVVIDNRGGAGGHVAAADVSRAPADGHTIVLTTIAHNAAHSMYANLSYDPAKDLKPVIVIAEAPSVLVVHPSLPVRTVQELVALARTHPGTLSYGSAGSGTALHMAAELFKVLSRTDITHVPYKGSAPALIDLLGGQIHMMFDSFPSAIPHVRSGKLRAIAVTSAQRAQGLPELPTIAGSGLPGYESVPWYSISAPAGIQEPVMRRLNEVANKALKAPELTQRWQDLGLTPLGGSPEDAQRRNDVETRRWSQVIKTAGIKVQ